MSKPPAYVANRGSTLAGFQRPHARAETHEVDFLLKLHPQLLGDTARSLIHRVDERDDARRVEALECKRRTRARRLGRETLPPMFARKEPRDFKFLTALDGPWNQPDTANERARAFENCGPQAKLPSPVECLDAPDLFPGLVARERSAGEARGFGVGVNPRERVEIARLKVIFDQLSAKATALREQQSANRLVIRLGNGKERRIGLGQIAGYHFPNELQLLGRIGMTFSNLRAFLFENPREANTEGGIFPAIVGTFVMTMLMSVCVTPFGVLAAIYLREYARQGPFVRAVRIAINNLAGVPSIVFGVFGLGFFVYGVGGTLDNMFFQDRLPTPTYGTGGIIWAAATLALMTVPVVIVATEESVAAVPRGAREGSLALGASKWQTIQRIVLPAAVPGILTGLILAMARGAGEVAPLMLVGVVKLAPGLPIDGTWNDTDLLPFMHLDQKFMHLGFHIYDLGFQSPDSDAAKPMVYATTFFLICLVLVLNLTAILMRERLRKKFATGAF
jgi:phosphate transport system permease protein